LRLFLAAVVGFAVTMHAADARAQLETFVQSVRELAVAAGQPQSARTGIRAAAAHMQSALAEWDRNIATLEARVARDRRGAPDLRAAQLHVELGVAYRTRGRLAAALREFDAATTLRPSGSDVRVLQALTLEASGRSAEAAQSFQAAWTLDPRNPVKAYYVAQRPSIDPVDRGRARAFLREYAAGAAMPAAAAPPFVTLNAIPDNLVPAPIVADETLRDAFALLAAEKYSEAVAAVTRAQNGRAATPATADDAPAAHFIRAQAAEAANHVADARREYQSALAGALAGRSAVMVGLGRLAQVDGDLSAAIDAFSRAAQIKPNDPEIHREFAATLTEAGKPDEAFCELAAALLIDPRDGGAQASIGQLHLDAGRDADAVAAFTRALELAPDRFEIRYGLATAQTRLGNGAEAARQLAIFERARREALDKRRREIGRDVEQAETIRRR
jgi:tetratricopeptide (TPR) repeat protein